MLTSSERGRQSTQPIYPNLPLPPTPLQHFCFILHTILYLSRSVIEVLLQCRSIPFDDNNRKVSHFQLNEINMTKATIVCWNFSRAYCLVLVLLSLHVVTLCLLMFGCVFSFFLVLSTAVIFVLTFKLNNMPCCMLAIPREKLQEWLSIGRGWSSTPT